MIAVSSIAVTLWLGGWMRPFASMHGGALEFGSWFDGGPWYRGDAVDFLLGELAKERKQFLP